MYNYNNLISIDFEGTTLKFNSLVIFNYFVKVSKSSEFKAKVKIIKRKTNKLFKEYYAKHNISNIEDGKLINNHIEMFSQHLTDCLTDEVKDLYDFFIEFQTETNSHKAINLIYEEFEFEIVRSFIMRILNLRQSFFAD